MVFGSFDASSPVASVTSKDVVQKYWVLKPWHFSGLNELEMDMAILILLITEVPNLEQACSILLIGEIGADYEEFAKKINRAVISG